MCCSAALTFCCGDRRASSHLLALQEPSSIEKVAEIDEHIGVAMSGLTADARTLIDHGGCGECPVHWCSVQQRRMCLPNQAAGAGVESRCWHAQARSTALVEASALLTIAPPNCRLCERCYSTIFVLLTLLAPAPVHTVGLVTGRVETQQHRFTYNEPMPLESVTQASSPVSSG